MTSSDDTVWLPAPGVIAQAVEGGAVLLRADTGEYFDLNETGARLWTLLGARLTERELGEAWLASEAVTPDRGRQDASKFLSSLREAGLIARSDG